MTGEKHRVQTVGRIQAGLAAAQIAQFFKARCADRGNDLMLHACGARALDERMGRERVGLARYPVEGERNAELRPGVYQPVVGAVAACAEFLRDVVGARDALPRQVRVQLERMKGDARRRGLGMALAVKAQSGLEAPLADEAPGTDHVGDDVDGESHEDFLLAMIPHSLERDHGRGGLFR